MIWICKTCREEVKFFPENLLYGRSPWAHTDKAHWVDKPHKAKAIPGERET